MSPRKITADPSTFRCKPTQTTLINYLVTGCNLFVVRYQTIESLDMPILTNLSLQLRVCIFLSYFCFGLTLG